MKYLKILSIIKEIMFKVAAYDLAFSVIHQARVD